MKNLLIFTNFLFLGIIVFQACNADKQTEPVQPIVSSPPGQIKDSCTCKDYSDYKLMNTIPARVAKLLAENYSSDKGKKYIGWKGEQLHGIPRKYLEDARSAWFDLDTLKAFIWQFEKAMSANCKDQDLGLRIYDGKYLSSEAMQAEPSLRRLPASYAHHQTFFFVPTVKIKGKNTDIDYRHIGSDPCNPRSLKSLMGMMMMQQTNVQYSIMTVTGTGDVSNHGGLIPPPPGPSGNFPIGD